MATIGASVAIVGNVMLGPRVGKGIRITHPAPDEVAGARRLAERIASERDRGLQYVDTLLDQLCRDVGLDPWEAWRRPRHDRRAAKLAETVAQVRADLDRVRDRVGRWAPRRVTL